MGIDSPEPDREPSDDAAREHPVEVRFRGEIRNVAGEARSARCRRWAEDGFECLPSDRPPNCCPTVPDEATVIRHHATVLARRLFIANPSLERWRCHRRADRSFSIDGRQFGVCARCTGLIAGGAVSPAALLVGSSLPWVALLAVAALALDGLTQRAGWRESTNALRLATGVLVGLTGPAALSLLFW